MDSDHRVMWELAQQKGLGRFPKGDNALIKGKIRANQRRKGSEMFQKEKQLYQGYNNKTKCRDPGGTRIHKCHYDCYCHHEPHGKNLLSICYTLLLQFLIMSLHFTEEWGGEWTCQGLNEKHLPQAHVSEVQLPRRWWVIQEDVGLQSYSLQSCPSSGSSLDSGLANM